MGGGVGTTGIGRQYYCVNASVYYGVVFCVLGLRYLLFNSIICFMLEIASIALFACLLKSTYAWYMFCRGFF